MTTKTYFFHDTVSREWRAPATLADYNRLVAQLATELSYRGGRASDDPPTAQELLAAIGIRSPKSRQ